MKKNWEIRYIVSVKNENNVTTVKVINSHDVICEIQEYYNSDLTFTNVRAEKHNKDLKKILYPFLIDIKPRKDEVNEVRKDKNEDFQIVVVNLENTLKEKDELINNLNKKLLELQKNNI